MIDKVLYKYRGVKPWDYLLDILINSRLFAATFQSLNDPMEGVFTYSQDNGKASFIEQMIDQKGKMRICALSRTYTNTLMWSYYAAAHKGLVVGVTIDDSGEDLHSIQDVIYSDDSVFPGVLGTDVATAARDVLSKKLPAWRHEREVRVFSTSEFVTVSLKSLYLGCQMPVAHKKLLRSLMCKMCPNVPVQDITRDELDSKLGDDII